MSKPDLLIHTAFKLFTSMAFTLWALMPFWQKQVWQKKRSIVTLVVKMLLVEAVLIYRDQVFMDWLTSRMMAAGRG